VNVQIEACQMHTLDVFKFDVAFMLELTFRNQTLARVKAIVPRELRYLQRLLCSAPGAPAPQYRQAMPCPHSL